MSASTTPRLGRRSSRTLQAYVLREHFRPFCLAFGLVSFVLVADLLTQVINQILGKAVPTWVILELFALNYAWIIALAAPMAVLVASLMAFGRLSADAEIIAVRAAGTDLWDLVRPVLLSAVALTAVLIVFSDRLLPEGNHRARELTTAINRLKPALSLTQKEWLFVSDLPGYVMRVERVDPDSGELAGVTIFEERDALYPVTVPAAHGKLRMSADGTELILELLDGEIHEQDPHDPDKYRRTVFKRHVIRLSDPGRALDVGASHYRSDRELTSAQMWSRVQRYEAAEHLEKQAASDIVHQLLNRYLPTGLGADYGLPPAITEGLPAGRPLAPLEETERTLGAVERHLDRAQAHRRLAAKYRVEIHKKFSIPFACLVFVLIGAPLGMAARRGGVGLGVGISIGFFLFYWACLEGGENLADRLLVAPWLAMWGPNILIGLIGIILTLRATDRLRRR